MKKKILAILLGITLLSGIAYASWDSTKPDQADTVAQGMSDTLDNFEAIDGTDGSLSNLVVGSSGSTVGIGLTNAGTGIGISAKQDGAATAIDIDNNSTGVSLNIDSSAGTAASIVVNNSNEQPHMRFTGDPTVASPTDGDLWYTGSSLSFRDGSTTVNLFDTTQMFEGAFVYDLSTASGDQAITGVGFRPTALIIIGLSEGTATASWGFADSDLTESSIRQDQAGNMQNTDASLLSLATDTGDAQAALLKTFDADGFTIAWTKISAPSGAGKFVYMAIKE